MKNLESIRHALQDERRKALINFMSEFIPLLQQEGFTFEDLLDALISWAGTQPNLSSSGVVDQLSEAVAVVHDAYKP